MVGQVDFRCLLLKADSIAAGSTSKVGSKGVTGTKPLLVELTVMQLLIIHNIYIICWWLIKILP